MLLLAFRSFFFIAVILGYSTGIWRLINDYFRHEFQTYLKEESQTNKYLLRDPPKPGQPEATDNRHPAPGRADHQQVTDSIMALFETTTTPAGTDAGANPFASDATTGARASRSGEAALRVAAAEVTDIRDDAKRDERMGGEGQGEDEDKWISYWSRRDRKRDSGMDESANAYCTISARTEGESFAGAVTRITQRIMPDGDDFGCSD
ncbi:uncharacterized protein LOC118517438 isoform X1 [Anopheles stephensi]|uniref:uncharacterized protein LOC118517438 isoform X1 n=1 Tax=Anopheles stephensi TaxID=30069 RepID=UPI0007D63ABA|nr:uncharacterized protein LOC118517438 isoform X1 [Anopheles stephensi]